MEILCGQYFVRSVLDKRAILPAFKGSTVRGIFGTALKRVVCALKRESCTRCILREKCAYNLVFEAPVNGDSGARPAAPHPFVIEPPLCERTTFEEGEALDFTLLLFGWANEYLPYFVYAFQEMGRIGLGRKMGGKRAAFRLTGVTAPGGTVYDERSGTLKTDLSENLKFGDTRNGERVCRRLRIVLETPLRIKYRNRPSYHIGLPRTRESGPQTNIDAPHPFRVR